MRFIVPCCLLAAMFAICNASSSAQVLKKDSKETKEEPKPEEPKQPEITWPKYIQGKNLDFWVRSIRESKDASTRDEAIRMVPFFGPDSRKAVGPNLILAITSEPDINVRLTAIATVPLIGFDDELVDKGFGAMIAILTSKTPTRAFSEANHTRFETTVAIGSCGPIARKAIPALIDPTLVDKTSWQNRKAAATALGRVGQPLEKDGGPDLQAIKGLIKVLAFVDRDPCHLVRREVVNSLLALGPPKDEATWKLLRNTLVEATKDTDKSVALWARVAYIRTEQDLIKENDPNLVAITKVLNSSEVIIKQQEEIEEKVAKLLDSNVPNVKQDAMEKKQQAIQTKQEALIAKQDAIQALGVIGEEARSRLPNLIAIVQGKNEEPINIATAIWALSQMPSETGKILPVIDEFKAAKDATIKTAAESAYKSLTDKPDPTKKKDAPPKS